jgi:hypothetical protein
MKKILASLSALALVALLGTPGPLDASTKRKPAASSRPRSKKPSASARKGSAPKPGTHKAPSKGKAPSARSKRRGATPGRKVTFRNRQSAPTPDRYREIQAALATKGYLGNEEATGTWGAASADALKRFQRDQNLEATGKVNSLSLIALGLGPRHEAPAAPPSAAPAASPAPSSPSAAASALVTVE